MVIRHQFDGYKDTWILEGIHKKRKSLEMCGWEWSRGNPGGYITHSKVVMESLAKYFGLQIEEVK